MIINIWLALRNDAHTAVKQRLNWNTETQGNYTGPVGDREIKIFRFMVHRAIVLAQFKKATISGNRWHLWNIVLKEPKDLLLKLQIELDYLETTYSTQFIIGGAWFFDGRQIGTQFVHDEDNNIIGVSGTPTYLLHPELINFMPDIITYDIDGNETSRTRPTKVSDVNLLQGQKERHFV